jgi:hypothetical protein
MYTSLALVVLAGLLGHLLRPGGGFAFRCSWGS